MLTLIGTIQDDVKGPRRLEALLSHISPSVVCVQAQEGLQFLYEKIDDFLRDTAPSSDLLPALVHAKEYEYLIPLRYCETQEVPLKRVGYPELPVHVCLELAKHFSLEDMLTRLHEEYDMSSYGEHIAAIEALYKGCEEPFFPEVHMMDAYVEKQLRKQTGEVVYVGSYGHIFGGYHNLYERLNDLRPKRIHLCEADWLEQ